MFFFENCLLRLQSYYQACGYQHVVEIKYKFFKQGLNLALVYEKKIYIIEREAHIKVT